MRLWILIGLLCVACTTTTTPTATQPTTVAITPTDTISAAPEPTPQSMPAVEVPNSYYRFFPATNSIERVTDTTVQTVATGISAHTIVANTDHSMVAIHTSDNTLIVLDVTTAQQYGPFDVCDSMAWAPDNVTLWCIRYGHIYTIDTNQVDQLHITAPDADNWDELIRHPQSNAYWMVISRVNEYQLCQYNPSTHTIAAPCYAAGMRTEWAPDGRAFAYINQQHVCITQVENQQTTCVGLGNLVVNNLVWRDPLHLAINTETRNYSYNIHDARISLQASEYALVGR